jgi:enhancing lycopene biosynthesis protein 2
MTFHQIIGACDPSYITDCDQVQAHIEYFDPLTGQMHTDERTVPIGDVVVENGDILRKADVIVGYAKALIVIGILRSQGNDEGAYAVAVNMTNWAQVAAQELGDPEVVEIAQTMSTYAQTLQVGVEG